MTALNQSRHQLLINPTHNQFWRKQEHERDKGVHKPYLGNDRNNRHSKLVSTLSMLLLSVLSLGVSQA